MTSTGVTSEIGSRDLIDHVRSGGWSGRRGPIGCVAVVVVVGTGKSFLVNRKRSRIDYFYKLVEGIVDCSFAINTAREELVENSIYEHMRNGDSLINVPIANYGEREEEICRVMESALDEFVKFDVEKELAEFSKFTLDLVKQIAPLEPECSLEKEEEPQLKWLNEKPAIINRRSSQREDDEVVEESEDEMTGMTQETEKSSREINKSILRDSTLNRNDRGNLSVSFAFESQVNQEEDSSFFKTFGVPMSASENSTPEVRRKKSSVSNMATPAVVPNSAQSVRSTPRVSAQLPQNTPKKTPSDNHTEKRESFIERKNSITARPVPDSTQSMKTPTERSRPAVLSSRAAATIRMNMDESSRPSPKREKPPNTPVFTQKSITGSVRSAAESLQKTPGSLSSVRPGKKKMSLTEWKNSMIARSQPDSLQKRKSEDFMGRKKSIIERVLPEFSQKKNESQEKRSRITAPRAPLNIYCLDEFFRSDPMPEILSHTSVASRNSPIEEDQSVAEAEVSPRAGHQNVANRPNTPAPMQKDPMERHQSVANSPYTPVPMQNRPMEKHQSDANSQFTPLTVRNIDSRIYHSVASAKVPQHLSISMQNSSMRRRQGVDIPPHVPLSMRNSLIVRQEGVGKTETPSHAPFYTPNNMIGKRQSVDIPPHVPLSMRNSFMGRHQSVENTPRTSVSVRNNLEGKHQTMGSYTPKKVQNTGSKDSTGTVQRNKEDFNFQTPVLSQNFRFDSNPRKDSQRSNIPQKLNNPASHEFGQSSSQFLREAVNTAGLFRTPVATREKSHFFETPTKGTPMLNDSYRIQDFLETGDQKERNSGRRLEKAPEATVLVTPVGQFLRTPQGSQPPASLRFSQVPQLQRKRKRSSSR
ncbi:unnamed protein product [Caenorhabditis auriculariae]|uniref:Uncharacterized protein n=1 Tax=Caenorhabditis auriculariae TaxID=2777116 RepID=A0A8S1GU69_9PELO|nr:unnamed protein product [Caenorhabditis auriculariae]